MGETKRPGSDLVVSPEPDEIPALQGLVDKFLWAKDVRLDFGGGISAEIPESLAEGIRRLATYMSTGASVAMRPYGETLTTQQAASLLGISRPHLVHLAEDEGLIPYEAGERPGRHRKLKLDDVLEYRDSRLANALLRGQALRQEDAGAEAP